jgi:transglutaminase-like putative cysteine protease
MIKKVIVMMLIGAPFVALGQKGEFFETYKAEFPDEPAIFVDRSEVMTLTIEKDSLRISSDHSQEILHLKEQTDAYASNRVHGSFFSHVKDIKAKTLVWDKNKYRELPVSDFKKNSDREDYVFYDDSYYYTFNFPSVASGNRTQLQYRETLDDPRFISGYVFSSYLPQERSAFTIKAPKEVELSYTVFNDPKSSIKFKKSEKGGVVTYEWAATKLQGFRSEDNKPAIWYTAPHVVLYVKSFTTKKGKVNVLNNLDDLYKWYYTFLRDLNKPASEELTAAVGNLKKQSKTELDLVRNIFYWVQSNIHYIAFEQGMRGLIPNDASYVCNKRYGDCKDMANLLVNMMSLAGVKGYHTWVGTRDLPYKYSELPSPAVDNHMIATYVSPEGRYYYLDATSDHTPFGFPSSMIQGKEVLISISDTKYEVKTVPVVSMKENYMTDSMQVRFDGNQLSGTGKGKLYGFAKVFGAYRLDRADQDDVRKYVTTLVGKGNNKFSLENYTVGQLENRDKPTSIDYAFRISDYHQKIGSEIFVNLNLNKEYYNSFITLDQRKYPIENEYQYVRFETVELEVPAGYSVEYIPENFSCEYQKFGCSITYVKAGNKIVSNKKFYLNHLLLQPEDFKEWNDAVRLFSNAYKESVILSKDN